MELIELGQRLAPGVLHYAGHPPFEYELSGAHGEMEIPGQAAGSSAATDRISTGLHVGTHIDGLSHVADCGLLTDGTDVRAEGVQSRESGIRMDSGSSLSPIVAPGVLLDFPAYLGCEVLPDEHVITVEELLGCAARAEVEIKPGCVVLIRTGFDLLWDEDPERYLGSVAPGPEVEVAQLLRERGIRATGSDTITYEQMPGREPMAVHVELLVKGGIPIIECLRLRELAERRVASFEFVALPLNMPHATGSPINPVAIVGGASR
jgi:kynurenine formamidase